MIFIRITHEKIIELSKSITEIDNNVKEQLAKRNKIKEELVPIKAELVSLKKDINELQAALHEEKAQEIKKETEKKEKDLKKRADEALNRLKSGEKIEYDDMVLLQKFDLM